MQRTWSVLRGPISPLRPVRLSIWWLVAVLMLPLLGLARPGEAATSWSPETSNTTANLYGVAFVDSSTWVAVGDVGTILRSTNGGVDWAPVSSPVADALRAVSFHGGIGVAVGTGGRVIRSTDRGLHWVQQARPTTKPLYGASMGSVGTVITGEEGSIFVSFDDGATWTPRFAGSASVFFGVSCRGSTAVAAGGAGAIAMSTDGGGGWGLTVIGTPLTFFYGTSFVTPATGWVVGTSSTIGSLIARSDDGGFVWSAQTAPTSATLTGVSCPTLTSGTAVGFGGTILHTADGGSDWIPETSNTTRSLNAVAFSDSITGIAVGDSGTVLRGSEPALAGVGDPAGPSGLALAAGPNPFRGSTRIAFRMPREGFATLKVFDVLGEEVATLVEGRLDAGAHVASFQARGLPSGVYYSRLEVRGPDRSRALTAERRVVLVK